MSSHDQQGSFAVCRVAPDILYLIPVKIRQNVFLCILFFKCTGLVLDALKKKNTFFFGSFQFEYELIKIIVL